MQRISELASIRDIVLIAIATIISLAIVSASDITAALPHQKAAAQTTSADFELPEFYNSCTDGGRGVSFLAGGACRKQSQFTQSSDSFVYWHDNSTGLYTKDCTAVFSGLPTEFTVKYRQEDGITQNGTGMARIDQVCWLLATRPTR